MKRLTALCGALLLTLVMAAPAAAVQPWVWYDEDFDDTYLAVMDCGDFMVDAREVGHASEKLYFADKDYEVTVRTLFKGRGAVHLINDDSGKEITAQFRVTCHVDIVQEDPLVYVRKCTGDHWNLSVKGAGMIEHTAGQFTEYVEGEPGDPGDVLKAVGTDWFNEDAVCAALAD